MDVQKIIVTMHNSLVRGDSLERLTSVFRKEIQNPICISDSSLRTMIYSGESDIEDHTWNKLISKDHIVHMKLATEISQAGLTAQLDIKGKPFLIDSDMFEHRWMTGLIVYRSKLLGYILVMEHHTPFSDNLSEALYAFCKIVAYYLVNKSRIAYQENPGTEMLLNDLLVGSFVEPQIIRDSLFPRGGKAGYRYEILAFTSTAKERPFTKFPYVLAMLQYRLPLSRGVFYDGSAILIHHYKMQDPPCINEEFLIFCKEQSLYCGVSKSYTDINDTARHYQQAITALSYAKQTASGQSVCHYDDCSFYDLLARVDRQWDLDEFCCSAIEDLIQYDQRYGTSYLTDLTVYFESGENISKAAKILDIHRNTMRYRVNKIESILGCSLQEPALNFKLRVSLHILRFLKEKTQEMTI